MTTSDHCSTGINSTSFRLSTLTCPETCVVGPTLWKKCLERLEAELPPQQFHTWIRPLHAVEEQDTLRLLAPNNFVRDWVRKNLSDHILEVLSRINGEYPASVVVEVGSRGIGKGESSPVAATQTPSPAATAAVNHGRRHGLRPGFTFDAFVEGKSNQLARAASMQVAKNPGEAYNPLFIYGGVGLGKTHLMHAIGDMIIKNRPTAKVVYLHSERFVADMVTALQHNAINDFKRYYRSVETLLIDDIQFFAGKERSQEEFFHTFNGVT